MRTLPFLTVAALISLAGCGKSQAPKLVGGAPCLIDLDCVSGFCDEGICTEPKPPEVGPQCQINGRAYADAEVNPENPCLVCDLATSDSSWTRRNDGTSCGPGQVCRAGGCIVGCAVGANAAVPAGTENPLNNCESCQPSVSATGYSAEADGESCGTGRVCVTRQCAEGCFIEGVFYRQLDKNPAQSDGGFAGCEVCDTTRSTQAWTYACFDYFLPFFPREAVNNVSSTLILQDVRDPQLSFNQGPQNVTVTYFNESFGRIGSEVVSPTAGDQMVLTTDSNVSAFAGATQSTVHTVPQFASAHVRAFFPVQPIVYLRQPTFSSSTSNDATAYPAPAAHTLGTTLYAPVVRNMRDGRWTAIAVMNAGTTDTQISMTFFHADGGVAAGPFNPVADGGALPSLGSVLVDQRTQNPALDGGYEGAAVITSSVSSIAAVVTEWGPTGGSTPAVGFASYLALSQTSARALLPNFSTSNASAAIDETLSLFNPTGGLLLPTVTTADGGTLSFPPIATNQQASVVGATLDGGFTHATVTSTQGTAGVVFEERTIGASPRGRVANAYLPMGAEGGAQSLYLPWSYSSPALATSPLSGKASVTRIFIANVGSRPEVVQWSFRTQLGILGTTGSVTIQPWGVHEIPVSAVLLSQPESLAIQAGSADARIRAYVENTDGTGNTQSVWSYTIP